ncbi:hypothetical protein [Amantichitinum ursilacus]|nr:hypothetical protein [Amantichitinum ursilacus]
MRFDITVTPALIATSVIRAVTARHALARGGMPLTPAVVQRVP